ncbi:MAG TPA: alpha/beta hydrolase [Ilumatobacteraceae bacterium]|nr:alpha/beta hydrolase [Ilumatobacteraceae bacterium]
MTTPGSHTSAISVLPAQRQGRPAEPDLAERRAMVNGLPQAPLVDGIDVSETDRFGVQAIVCTAPTPVATIAYLHGGGFRLGTVSSWTAFATRLADAGNARVVLIEYRLSPEAPYPNALHDCVTAVEAIVAEYSEPLIIAGDSAGGGLAASVTAVLRDAATVDVAGAILISPWADLTVTADSYTSRTGRDQLFSRDAATSGAELYLQGHDPKDPYASPLFADHAGFPPVQIFVGGEEVLLDDSLALVNSIASAGVSVEAHVAAGMQHVWMTLFADLPESQQALAAMAAFIQRVAA